MPNPRLKKLRALEQRVLKSPLMQHMRRMAYGVYKGTKEAVATGSDAEALEEAAAKRLRKKQKRVGTGA